MLVDQLKQLLATEFSFYIKCKGFHWNVCGSDFVQLHQFFDMIATESYSALDKNAEYIRVLESFAPASFSRFSELSLIKDQVKIPRANLMLSELLADNQIVIAFLKEVFTEANSSNNQDIANYIAERLDSHNKWDWQIKSILKSDRA